MNQIAGSIGFVLLILGCFSMLGAAHMTRKLREAKARLDQSMVEIQEARVMMAREMENMKNCRLELEAATAAVRADREAIEGVLMPGDFCGRCLGCGQIDDGDAGEPWSAWMEMPVQSAVAVVAGIIKPITCPSCGGSGKRSV